MGTASPFRGADRSRLHGAFLARSKLPNRLLWVLLEQRHRSQHIHQVLRWRLLSIVYTCNVSQPWCTVGK